MEATYELRSDGTIDIYTGDAPELMLTPVTSSRLVAVGYDETRSLLFIAFPPTKTSTEGSVYEYQSVDGFTYEEMMEAESIGSFFGTHIAPRGKPAPFPYRKLDKRGDAPSTPREPANNGLAVVPAAMGDSIPELPAKDEELKGRALSVKAAAASLTVVGDRGAIIIATFEACEQAKRQLLTMKAERKLVYDRLQRVYEPAYKTYVEARTLRDEAVAPYDEAEEMLKKGILAYQRKESDDRRQAEIAETRRLEEKSRAEAKEKAQSDAAREAEYAEAQGEPELAESIRANPLPVAPAPVAPVVMEKAVPVVKGVTTREKWTYRIVDASQIPLTHEFYTLDEKKLNAKAKLLKSHANIPGVEVFDEGTIASR